MEAAILEIALCEAQGRFRCGERGGKTRPHGVPVARPQHPPGVGVSALLVASAQGIVVLQKGDDPLAHRAVDAGVIGGHGNELVGVGVEQFLEQACRFLDVRFPLIQRLQQQFLCTGRIVDVHGIIRLSMRPHAQDQHRHERALTERVQSRDVPDDGDGHGVLPGMGTGGVHSVVRPIADLVAICVIAWSLLDGPEGVGYIARMFPSAFHRRCFPLTALVLVVLSGCSGFRPPTASLREVTIIERGNAGTTLQFTFELENPNAEPMELQDVTYRVSLDGTEVFRGRRATLTTLPAGGMREVAIPAVVLSETLDLSAIAPAQTVPYAFSGALVYIAPGEIAEILLDTGVRKPTTRIRASGQLNLPESEGGADG